MDQTPEKIRGMFSAITPTYDRLNRLLSGSLDRRWRRRAAREALRDLQPCARLLDVATGTGDLAWTLAQTARQMTARQMAARQDPQCHKGGAACNQFAVKGARINATIDVTGVDFTRPMLERAARKFPAPNFHWIEGDGLRLPLAAGVFDAVTVAFGLRNMADKPAALRELARVTRPGGRVAILEFSQPRNQLFRALYDFYSFTVMPHVGRWLSGSDAYLYLSQSIRAFWGPEELSDQMRRVGLKQVQAIPLMFGVVYLHVGVK